MEISSFLIISPGKRRYSPNVKLVKSLKGNMPSSSVALKLNIEIPDSIFQKPQLQATIKINEADISKPIIDAKTIDNIKEVLSQHLAVDMSIKIIQNKKQK